MVTIETNYLTNSLNYKNKTMTQVKGIMLHSVGCPQPNPDVFVKNWDNSNRQVGVHGFIGADKVVITLPCLEVTETSKPGYVHRAWHCGSGSKGSFNNGYIAFECCEPSNLKYTGTAANFTCADPTSAVNFMMKVFKNAVEIFAKCCIYHNIDPSAKNAIICHSEGNALGYASAHADVSHLFNQLPFDYSMDQFRKDVIVKVKELKKETSSSESSSKPTTPVTKPSTTTKPTIDISNPKQVSTMSTKQFTELMRKYRATLQNNNASSYSSEARNWAIKNGIISGNGTTTTDGTPNYMWADFLTREQFITVLYRFAKQNGFA